MATVDERPRTYEECLAEIQALKASPDYDDWGDQHRPNKGCELTPESFQRPPEFTEGWANRLNGLFTKSRDAAE